MHFRSLPIACTFSKVSFRFDFLRLILWNLSFLLYVHTNTMTTMLDLRTFSSARRCAANFRQRRLFVTSDVFMLSYAFYVRFDNEYYRTGPFVVLPRWILRCEFPLMPHNVTSYVLFL